MSNIPTADQFLWEKHSGLHHSNEYGNIQQYAIAFAKLHVEAALKAAADNAETTFIDYDEAVYNGKFGGATIVKSSILSAYPLTNIK